MSQQTSITSYFGKRKRIAADDGVVLRSKKLLLHENASHFVEKCNEVNAGLNNAFASDISKREHGREGSQVEIQIADAKNAQRDAVAFECANGEEFALKDARARSNEEGRKGDNPGLPVAFKLMGSLSPTKRIARNNCVTNIENKVVSKERIENLLKTPEKQMIVPQEPKVSSKYDSGRAKPKCTTDDVIKSAKELVSRIKETTKQASASDRDKRKKELSLKEVKDKLKQSAKLNELKKSINKINEQAAVLIELENRRKANGVPKLSKFKAIEVDVPLSPQKNALYSPSKVEKSPAKPAYERFNFLAEAGTALPLPFAFQKLLELFRAVDTISSMMLNRGEDITFSKLKPAVQEMTRKTFTLRHLGQMAAVLPNAFSFRQEKVRNFGSTSKIDRYDLVITPTFPEATPPRAAAAAGADRNPGFGVPERMSMTPKIIKARREAFYEALLDKTKECHEEFLRSLEPPMEINRKDLKRWHPNFMVDHVPDIVPRELPQPPHSDRPATAKEVLERAKDFLSSNARLQKALESASQSCDEPKDITSVVSPAIKEKVDSRLSNPLKGISKSLLERVRARQAAKALDSMRMTPQQEKETVMYTRLPAVARIVRTLFVNEQRGVLSWESALEKVQFSYNRSLGKGELETHLNLLVQLLPEWLSVVHIRNGNYLKMNPSAELASVMAKLERIVSEKTRNG